MAAEMLHSPPRIAAIDFGTKSVGLALADPRQSFAQPWGAYSQDEALEQLRRFDRETGLGIVVVGWPLTEDGRQGKATKRVQAYINRLRKTLKETLLVKWDERYTSEEARGRLRAIGGSIPKGRVDTAAAGVILQDYLDAQARNRVPEAS